MATQPIKGPYGQVGPNNPPTEFLQGGSGLASVGTNNAWGIDYSKIRPNPPVVTAPWANVTPAQMSSFMQKFQAAGGVNQTPQRTTPTKTPAQQVQAQELGQKPSAPVTGPRQALGSKFTDFPRLVQQMQQGPQMQVPGQLTRQDYHAYMNNLYSWLQDLFKGVRGENIGAWVRQNPMPQLQPQGQEI